MEEEKLIRFLNRQSSRKEDEEVSAWLSQPGSDKALEEMFQKTWTNNAPPEPGCEALYDKMLKKIHDATAVKRTRLIPNKQWVRWTGMAAGYLLLLLSAFLLFQMWNKYTPPVEQATVVERTTVAGEKLKIKLPDQSTVIVNSLSTIRFDADFGKTNRLIHLEGEAYFEIKPDKDLPFVVQTQDVRTTALGTAFNAKSKNEKVAISLTEGKVSVSHHRGQVELKPGQMAVLDNFGKNGLKLGNFDPGSVTAWKEGKISFKSNTLEEILADLEDWYGVKFSTKGKVGLERKVTGVFDNNNLQNILNGLSFSLNLEYSINGTEVIIQPLRPME